MQMQLYADKLQNFKQQPAFQRLTQSDRQFIESAAQQFRLTHQEFRQIAEACRDLEMWLEQPLSEWWQNSPNRFKDKKEFLTALQNHMRQLRQKLKIYHHSPEEKSIPAQKYQLEFLESDKKIHGMCPVASPDTVCCNLRTIDAVENCAYGCSYCTIQTFYNKKVVFDANFAGKLQAIELDPQKFYHFGTGQSSDSLAFGNRNGNLDALCEFARRNPNVLLEFKTKSENISWLLKNKIPPNIVCAWSINPQRMIDNEEHLTASLQRRLSASRKVADKGIKVGFHFHPMIYYSGWEEEYSAIAAQLLQNFDPSEILFISMGSVTFIKPVMRKIRDLGRPTKILQMEFVPDPKGKWTYPDDIKIRMFRKLYQNFSPWHEKVFFYLCMEKAEIWQAVYDFVYPDNESFENTLLKSARTKSDFTSK